MEAKMTHRVAAEGKPRARNDASGIADFLPLVGGRARRVLRDLGINSVQQLLDLAPARVLAQHSSGAKTWDEIQKIQRLACKRRPVPADPDEEPMSDRNVPWQEQFEPIPEASRGSFENLVRYWLTTSLTVGRVVWVMDMRIGIANGAPATLEQCAASMRLTRERVRQIQSKAQETLRRPTVVAKILEFWSAVSSSLEAAGGIISLEELGEALRQNFRWSDAPRPGALAAVLEFCPAFHVSGRRVTGKEQQQCLGCPVVRASLNRIISERTETAVPEVSEMLAEACADCPEVPVSQPREFSSSFITQLLESDESLRAVARFHDGVLYPLDEWTLRYGPLYLAASIILRRHGSGMHFTEVAKELGRVRQEDISERSLHGHLNRCEDVLLWDRGTFIHMDHVKVPEGLLNEVEAWIADELRKGIPCLSVAGVFTQFEEKCREAGVTSESALYTCLRKSANRALAYPRYPYIYLHRRGLQHVPAYLVVEEWLREVGEPVSNERLTDFVCNEMGMKPFQFTNIKKQLPNVVQTDAREYLHTSLLPFGEHEVTSLVSHVRQLLSRAPSLSAAKLYRDKQVTCHAMGISGPRMLFSVLRTFASDKVECSGYPTVRMQSAQNAGKWRGVIGEVESYLQAKKRPCSSDEIAEEFVERLGYRPGTVFSVQFRGNVFRYLEGCFVHRSTLEWDERKQSQLAAVLHNAYREALRAGALYAELDRVIEMGERELPLLASALPWTDTLLAGMALRCEGFAVLGSAENVLVEVPNDLGIVSLENLVAMILKNEYGGAANLEDFTKAMRARRIVRKSLTPAMLGEQAHVVIADHEIMLKELS